MRVCERKIEIREKKVFQNLDIQGGGGDQNSQSERFAKLTLLLFHFLCVLWVNDRAPNMCVCICVRGQVGLCVCVCVYEREREREREKQRKKETRWVQ